ncbi:hypothetical protein [Clostridium mobile]|nr:hypothetical protein [Clostridium mobile]
MKIRNPSYRSNVNYKGMLPCGNKKTAIVADDVLWPKCDHAA